MTLVPLLLLLFLATGVQAAAPHLPKSHPGGPKCVPEGRWLDPADGKTLTNTALLRHLAKKRVVLLGEDHDNLEHHRWQLIVLAQLHALQEGLRLGFESFPRSAQAVLDRWVAGELTESRFLEQVRWDEVWRYDPAGYLPLFHFARLYRIPMIALNVERALVTRVGQEGWHRIPGNAREGVGDPAPPAPDYVDLLAEIYTRHSRPHEKGEVNDENDGKHMERIKADPRFQRFVQGQLLWDRAMAEAIAIALRDGAPQVAAIAGAGHLMGGYGIPHQLADLGIHDVAVLLPWDGAIPCEALKPGLADAVFGMAPPSRVAEEPPRPRLGVYLQRTEAGVRVTKVTPGSVAEAAGIRTDDHILAIAGREVTEVGQVVEAVQATPPGAWLPLTVRRGEQRLEVVAKFPPAEAHER